MIALPLSWNASLGSSSRCAVALPAKGDEIGAIGWRDAACILAAGITTALCVNFIDGSFKIPGSAILRSILPLTCGIALVPRRMTGTCVGLVAYLATLAVPSFGGELAGVGARTSMTLIGPVMDLALWYTRGAPWLYLQCALAGLAANLGALVIRASDKAAGVGEAQIRLGFDWWTTAPWSYAGCGLLAGLISGLLWFHWNTAPPPEAPKDTP